MFGGDKIEPWKALIQSIIEYPRPETKNQIRSFVGLVGYYRKFIPNFSQELQSSLILQEEKNPTKVKWLVVHKQAFLDLKEAMQKPLVLRLLHWDEFILQVDGVGAILCQKR